MKTFCTLLLLCICITGFAQHEHAKTTTPIDTTKKSIPREVHQQIGPVHIMIHYYAPAVRGRMIWGGLVSYEEVWVTGAHSATTVEIDKSIIINETELAPGKYALFTIPGKEKWIIIVNKNWEQHLADEYDSNDDILRVEVTPVKLTNIQERLTYTVDGDVNKGTISISWEKIKVALPFSIPTN